MRSACFTATIVLMATASNVSADSVKASPEQVAVQTALDASAAAWTAGKLDLFMTYYADEPTTTYVSGGRVVTGYRAIRDMYASRFGGGGAAMGRLTLEILDFRLLGPDYGLVVGRYHLFRPQDPPAGLSGLTTLVFRRTPAGWRIISDHTG